MLVSTAAKPAWVMSTLFLRSGRLNTLVECQFWGDIGSCMLRIDFLEVAELEVHDTVVMHGLRNATDLNGTMAVIVLNCSRAPAVRFATISGGTLLSNDRCLFCQSLSN